MTATTVTYKDGKLTVSSKDLLEDWKKKNGKSKDYLSVAPFLIRVEIPLDFGGLKGELTNSKIMQKKLLAAAEDAADKNQKRMEKALDELLKDLEKLALEDSRQNKRAGAEAEKLVPGTEKVLKGELPDFGHSIRKAVEGVVGKLPGNVRSTSSGAFKGLQLTYEFTAAEGDEGFVDVYTETAKILADASENVVKQCRTLDRSRDDLEKTIETARKEKDPGENAEVFIQKEAKALRGEVERHGEQAEDLEKTLRKVGAGVAQKLRVLLGKGEQTDRNALTKTAIALSELCTKLGARKGLAEQLAGKCRPVKIWEDWQKQLTLVHSEVENLEGDKLEKHAVEFANWAEAAEKKAKTVGK